MSKAGRFSNGSNCVVINPKGGVADFCVVWLHGLGANGKDFAAIVPELNLPANHSIRFVFPNASERPITLNFGMTMPGWYDIMGISENASQDVAGIHQTTADIHHLLDQQIASGIPSERIVVGGFSQGGAVTLYAGLTYQKPLAGLIPLSTYLPISDVFLKNRHPENFKTPLLMVHGTQDRVVPFEFGKSSKNFLKELNYHIEWKTYPIEHNVCSEELGEISTFLQKKAAR